jgi:predicted RNase H-like HicB family nuclease
VSESRYTVSILKSEEGFSVWVPGLPGCASQGETEQEALENIQAAIKEYLEVAEELATGERREVTVVR